MGKEARKLRHIAVIMDGNGRWAEQHKLERIEGHKKGSEVVIEIVKAAKEIGLEYLTLYAFSTENWKRPGFEVSGLMNILNDFLTNRLYELMDNGIRLKTIGRTEQLPEGVRRNLAAAIRKTADNKCGTLVLALSYGGRAEIVDAVKKIVKDANDGKIKSKDVDETCFARYLYDPEIPDPDLMIRTSGEYRISNFLLWQLSYSEFYITETLWPDFNKEELMKAVEAYNMRSRRFGGR
ncbi:MAG: isoprenyl transferase [Victivallaceae bacterium]|jgi:undecaprenyl diphosphate synthase